MPQPTASSGPFGMAASTASPVAASNMAAGHIEAFLRFFDHQPGHAPSFDETLRDVAEALKQTLAAAHASIWIPNPSAGVLDLAYTNFDPGRAAGLPQQLPLKESRCGGSYESGRAALHELLESPPPCWGSELLREAGLTKMWCVPLYAGAQKFERNIIALATLHYAATDDPARFPLNFVEFCGKQAGRAIEHALWAEQDALIQKTYLAINLVDKNPHEAMDDVAREIARHMHFEACALLLADEATRALRIAGTTGIDSPRPRDQMAYEFGQSATGRVAELRGIVATENLDREPWYHGSVYPDRIETKSLRQFLGAPVESASGQLIGVIRLRNKRSQQGASWPRRLNYLDWLRIRRVAIVTQPMFSFLWEQSHKEDLLGRTRHDVMMPATMIRDFAAYFRRMSREEFTRRLDEVYQKLEDCESLCDIIMLNADLMGVSNEDEIELRPERTFLLGGFVAKLCKMLAPKCRQMRMKGIFYDDFSTIPELWVDRRLMEIAVYNLLQNAIKYGYRDTSIEIKTERVTDERGGPHFLIHIQNYGIGVNDAMIEKIFERFYRTPEAKSKSPSGAGIGLHVARSIVERHGGTLRLTSLHSPTVFTMDLPGILASRAPK